MASQRKLSRQQRKRIHDRHRQWQASDADQGHSGTVVAHFGGEVLIETGEEKREDRQRRMHARANLGGLVAGDQVIWHEDDTGEGVVVARLKRHGQLQRPNRFGGLRTVAANVDLLILVIAPEPAPQTELVDRYLAAAEIYDLDVVILLNKADLLEPDMEERTDPLLQRYTHLGYRIERTSARGNEAIGKVPDFLNQRTSVIGGQSGVGKSSLIKQWLPDVELRIGELSRHGEGTHTTTTPHLYRLRGGGAIIDSPGIREFGLWHMTPEDITRGFVDVRQWLGYCRFRDCRHRNEPGCALKQAVERGELHPQRFEHYLRLHDEAANQTPTS